MTFEFLKEKYPKEGLVVVHSLTELVNVFYEYIKNNDQTERLTILIPFEVLELNVIGMTMNDVEIRLGQVDYFSEFNNVDIFVMMEPRNYRRGLGLR